MLPPGSPVPDAEVQAALQVIFQGTASETGERFFMALVENLARALGTRGAWVAEIMPAQRRLRALAFWLGGEWVQNYEHAIDLCAVVLSRGAASDARVVEWDGRTLGPWANEIDGAEVVINLAGRSVNCRYTDANLKAMMDSRVDSTRAVGLAIEKAARPPRVWLQMSTATIYAHRLDAPNDEATGLIGGDEPDAPGYWKVSIDIAKAWERTQQEANTPRTRKVALRSAIVMSPERGGIFDVLLGLTRSGLGGSIAGGRQFVPWIHDRDFARAVELLIERDDIEGPVNLAAPNPIPQRDFMAALRAAWGARVGLPATKWMVEIGAFFLRTDTELTLKSRRVVPQRLLDAGFTFEFPEWPAAARNLVERRRAAKAHG